MKYLLDANVFVTAARLHYGFDFCPAFWRWLEVQHKAGKVFSIGHVKSEIVDYGDRVSRWAKKDAGQGFFLSAPPALATSLANVDAWLQSQEYTESAIQTFGAGADYYLVAHALHENFAVVTHEVAAESTEKVKIPNVCNGLSVKCMTPYKMLRDEKARFVL